MDKFLLVGVGTRQLKSGKCLFNGGVIERGCLIGFWRGQGRGNGQLSGGSAGDAPVGEGGGGAAFKGAIALAGQLVRSGVKYRSEVAIASAVGWRS